MDFTALDRMDVAPCNGRQLSDNDLNTVEIDRRDVGHVRKAGDFILRIGYHEAVHAGQMLQYLINLSAKGKHSELAAEPATSLSWLTPPSSREDAMYELSADGICVPLFGLQ
jgi:hypothetical protein